MEEVGSIIPGWIGKHLPGADRWLVEILGSLWWRAVGKSIAQHSRPLTFVSGTLTMAASCSSWAAQLGQMSEELRAEINSFLGRPVVRKLRVLYVPSLVLQNGNSATEAAKWQIETKQSKSNNADPKPGLELAKLDPEIASLVADAFAKYFSRAADRSPARRAP